MIQHVSLLPYLESSNGFKLEPEVFAPGSGLSKNEPYPFPILNGTACFTSLLKARVTTDCGSEIIKAVILQQSDTYRAPNDPLFNLTNKTIDQYWQQAFASLNENRSKNHSPSPIFLKTQIDQKKQLLPFQPLFVCSFKKRYFHPPCPICGSPLLLCQDDALLKKWNLQPYETSLKRYLYCASCAQETEAVEFFIHHPDPSEPSHLKDVSALIHDFTRLIKNSKPAPGFPCRECAENKTCYGPNFPALSHLAPYSFYPFYLFLFKDDSLNAVQFLTLLSGAGQNQRNGSRRDYSATNKPSPNDPILNASKIPHSLFPPGSDEYFLEIFYLKLSFLSELAHVLFATEKPISFASFPRSLNQVRVKFPEQAGLLPVLWNFHIQIFDLGEDDFSLNGLPKTPPIDTLYFIANVWFYTLLANNVQSFDQIRSGLNLLLPGMDTPDELALFKMDNIGKNKIFAPENIFRDPSGHSVDFSRRTLWEEALHLGRSLLIASLNRETEWSNERFLHELDGLKDATRKSLFEKEHPPIEKNQKTNDPAIIAILSGILGRWQSAGAVPQGDHASAQPNTLPSDKIPSVRPKFLDQTSASDKNEKISSFPLNTGNEYIRETTLISPLRKGSPKKEPNVVSEYISETVIIQPSSKKKIKNYDHP